MKKELTPDKLNLIFILCSICLREDMAALDYFIQACAITLETEEFDKVLRKSLKILDQKSCGRVACSDWLMNELFTLYKLG